MILGRLSLLLLFTLHNKSQCHSKFSTLKTFMRFFLWQGGFVDDFLSHLMCCCCALVQEWREVEIRGIYGTPPIYRTKNLTITQKSYFSPLKTRSSHDACIFAVWFLHAITLNQSYEFAGPEKTKTSPPPSQFMESWVKKVLKRHIFLGGLYKSWT